MDKFLIEVEQFDESGKLMLSIGNSDLDGEMDSSITITDVEDEDMELDSTYLLSHTMEWDELAEFLISYAPLDFVPKLMHRVIKERDAYATRLTDIAMEKLDD